MLSAIVTAFYILVSAGIFDPDSPRENVVQDGEMFGSAEVDIDAAGADGVVRVGVLVYTRYRIFCIGRYRYLGSSVTIICR